MIKIQGASPLTGAFSVGDTYAVTAQGEPPNTPVQYTRSVNNTVVVPWMVLGDTDANGNFAYTGVFGPSDVGGNSFSITIGGSGAGMGVQVVPNMVNIDSGSAPILTPTVGTITLPVVQNTNSTNATSTTNATTQQAVATNTTNTPADSLVGSFDMTNLTSQLTTGNGPLILLAAGIGLLMMMDGGK